MSIIATIAAALRPAPRKRYLKRAAPGAIVYARHDIPGLLGPVPGATRGVLLTWVHHRDPNAAVIVKWDRFGNRDAKVADLSPHFEPGPPLTVPRRGAAVVPPSAATSSSVPSSPAPRQGERVKNVVVTEEPYDPTAPLRPEPPARAGEHVRVEIITEEPL